MKKLTTLESLSKLKDSGKIYQEVFRRGSLCIEIYKPERKDPQKPHLRDEIYVIISGTGDFVCEGQRTTVQTGDLFFVSAGTRHRFEYFSSDFSTRVIFYGPEGGELPDK